MHEYHCRVEKSARESTDMSLSDLKQIDRKPRRAKSLLERARKYIGAIKTPLKPRNTAAQAKTLVRGIAAAKQTR